MWECTPPGGIHVGEKSALAGRRGPQVYQDWPWSITLEGRRGPQELQEHV
jgi:hypothetical protein